MLSPTSLQSPQFAACSRTQVRFGHNDHDEKPAEKPEAHTTSTEAPKKKGLGLGGVLVGGFLLVWAGIFGALGINFFSQMGQVRTVLSQENKDSIAKMTVNIPGLNKLDIDITENRHVKAGGLDLGYIMPLGQAYTADGRRIGNVDQHGNLFSALMPGQPIGRLNEDGTVSVNFGLIRNGVVTIVDPNNRLSASEKASAALVVIAHPDNMRR